MGDTKRIGILGGGQLGRMLCEAAKELDLETHIFCPEGDACAIEKADKATQADYTDEAALKKFAAEVKLVTFEFENIPLKTAHFLQKLKPDAFFPPPEALACSQDRAKEKTFLNDLGIATAPWCLGTSPEKATFPAIVKTRRLGYDGKGQVSVATKAELTAALETLDAEKTIIESKVPFDREIAFCCARARSGEIAFYSPVQTFHSEGILRKTLTPIDLNEDLQKQGFDWCKKITSALNYVGILAVETFQVGDKLRVNEIAPRVHNSYHWTIEGAETSHFAQHLRAIAGLPLGSPLVLHKNEMINIIGTDKWEEWKNKPNHFIHLYNKGEARAGRKMGHLTRLLVP